MTKRQMMSPIQKQLLPFLVAVSQLVHVAWRSLLLSRSILELSWRR